MFDFGNANINQKEAITHTEGPLLIIAGPGTGKTYTLVKRTIYLILEKKVKPEEIMIVTYTEKAAKELVTRITNELDELNLYININDMYIGTIHSICLRLLKENIDYTNLKKNYKVIDEFEQQYLIYQNISKFYKIANFDYIESKTSGAWRASQNIADYINNISEELIDFNLLKSDSNLAIKVIGEIVEIYNEILEKNNYLDFTRIQTETYNLLKYNPEILEKLNQKIKYVMVDEYQDTNHIQEQLTFMLAGKSQNLCVVGDDDQGLYRFRGATIRNIIEFPSKFEEGKCKKIYLSINYRSEEDIIDFYNKWMENTKGDNFSFEWDKFRHKKKIVMGKTPRSSTSNVIKVSAEEYEENWYVEIFNFINLLKEKSNLSNLNQIAFLFNSVRNEKVINLANFLEQNGINVYSPRSRMFFERDEIKTIIGLLLLMFPQYVDKLKKRSFRMEYEELLMYYEECINGLEQYIGSNPDLVKFIRNTANKHLNLFANTDYAFTGLVYKLFEFEPFQTWLNTDLSNGIIDQRAIRNLSLFSQMVSRHDYLHHLDVLAPSKIEKNVETFFNTYLRFLIEGGVGEYEDEKEYAPSGCVLFSTIHQAKGMEFPIVIVDSLGNRPMEKNKELIWLIEEKYSSREEFEPQNKTKYFDFWRMYYTAFSRAQNLLVLSCVEKNEGYKQPSKYFREIYDDLIPYSSSLFDCSRIDIEELKKVNIKNTYSFTSHISVYENCSLQYKFYKELGFSPVRIGSTMFGQLVHQTIEDIHKAAIRKEYDTITTENIRIWLDTNYDNISKSEHSYLGKAQIESAYEQVIEYYKRKKDLWDIIQEAEVEIGLVRKDYILDGVVDLIQGKDNTVEIVDFKSEKKPDIFLNQEKFERYRKQLQIYAYLIEKKLNKRVSKMSIYYTAEKNAVPTVSFDNNTEEVDSTIKEFDNIVKKIERKDFSKKSESETICNNCDFRFYCKK